MRWAASRASGCRGVVACASARSAWSRARVGIARGAVPLGFEDLALGAPERRVHEVQPPPVQVEPATGGGQVARVEREPRRQELELQRQRTHPLAGLARRTNPRRLVHAPPRRLGIPLRPRERPEVEGAHAREAREGPMYRAAPGSARASRHRPSSTSSGTRAYRGRFGFAWPPRSITHAAIRSAAAATRSRSARSSA